MKRFFTLLSLVFVSLFIFADGSFSFLNSVAAGWTASVSPYGYESTNSARGCQWSKTNGTLTLAGCSNVTAVKVKASANVADSYTLAVSVGGAALGTAQTVGKVTNVEFVFQSATPLNGDVVVSFTQKTGAKSFYIGQVDITGTVPETQQSAADRLDPEYVYNTDPVIIEPAEALGQMAIDTVIDNIWLQSPNGAYYESDIRVYAGASLTITASQPIKAVKINGVTKKGFSATASDGEITYLSDSEADATGAPVLLVKNINAESVTISCEKQLQMQAIYVYFAQNPDDEIQQQGGQDDGSESIAYDGPVTSTGELSFTSAGISTGDWDIDASILFEAYSFDVDAEGYLVGDGDYISFSFYPQSIENIEGTYSIASATIDDEYSEFMSYVGEDGIEDYFESATITITKQTDGTYILTYNVSLYENQGLSYSGTISGFTYTPNVNTAIELVGAEPSQLDVNKPMYNVLGQPVRADYIGIVIQNGRKYLLRQR